MSKERGPTTDTMLRSIMTRNLERPASRTGRSGWILFTGSLAFVAGVVGGLLGVTLLFPLPVGDTGGTILGRARAVRSAPTGFPALAPIAAVVVDVFTVDGTAPTPSLLPLAQRRGRGVVLTSDGWVATLRSALPARAIERPVVVTHDRRIRIVDRVAEDPISDLAFLHVVELEASVLPFRERDGLASGTPLFAPTTDGGITPVTLRAPYARTAPGAVHATDRWGSVLALDSASAFPFGTPIVDGAGALVGVALDAERAIAADAITTALPSLFARGEVVRNVLGVTYRDATEFGHGETSDADGVVLMRAGSAPLFTAASPLRGVLAEGDILLAVGDESLTTRRLLSELLQEYPAGATVRIRARHGTSDVEREVVLPTTTGRVLVVGEPAERPRRP